MPRYHERKFKKCKYCENEARRHFLKNGRNKGSYLTCGSFQCKSEANKLKEIKWRNKPELHPQWIKDRNKVKRQRTISELRWWRKAIFERDRYRCFDCGQKGYKLNAHHIYPYATYPRLRIDLNNGITLCLECHKKTDSYGKIKLYGSPGFKCASRISKT